MLHESDQRASCPPRHDVADSHGAYLPWLGAGPARRSLPRRAGPRRAEPKRSGRRYRVVVTLNEYSPTAVDTFRALPASTR